MKAPTLFLSLAAAALLSGLALAETVIVNDGIAVRESNLERPTRGMSMSAVEAKFGPPTSRHAAVGRPPITRWDYPGFSVFFEHQHVIHSVVVADATPAAPAPAAEDTKSPAE